MPFRTCANVSAPARRVGVAGERRDAGDRTGLGAQVPGHRRAEEALGRASPSAPRSAGPRRSARADRRAARIAASEPARDAIAVVEPGAVVHDDAGHRQAPSASSVDRRRPRPAAVRADAAACAVRAPSGAARRSRCRCPAASPATSSPIVGDSTAATSTRARRRPRPAPGSPTTTTPRAREQRGEHGGRVARRVVPRDVLRDRGRPTRANPSFTVERAERTDLVVVDVALRPRRHVAHAVVAAVVADDAAADLAHARGDDAIGERLDRREQARLPVEVRGPVDGAEHGVAAADEVRGRRRRRHPRPARRVEHRRAQPLVAGRARRAPPSRSAASRRRRRHRDVGVALERPRPRRIEHHEARRRRDAGSAPTRESRLVEQPADAAGLGGADGDRRGRRPARSSRLGAAVVVGDGAGDRGRRIGGDRRARRRRRSSTAATSARTAGSTWWRFIRYGAVEPPTPRHCAYRQRWSSAVTARFADA